MPYFCAIQGTILCPLSQSDQWPAPPQGPGGCGSERESGGHTGQRLLGCRAPEALPLAFYRVQIQPVLVRQGQDRAQQTGVCKAGSRGAPLRAGLRWRRADAVVA